MEESVREKHEGTVIFLTESKGSKSEHSQPYLYVNKSTLLPIMFKGDNPFENNKLEMYDGKKVVIIGNNEKTRVFNVESIYLSKGTNEEEN